jgi:RNA 3'-terminal phosphate cyclase-like protein
MRKKASAGPAPIFDNGAVVVGTAKPAAPAEGSASAYLRFSGSAQFRQRLVNSLLSKRRIRIDDIRSDSERPGLQDFEASFLRLLDKLTNGTALEINETGTALRFVPGVLQGGVIEHDCGLSRSVGWFIEGILPLLPFCKKAAAITLTGITSDAVDWGVDALRSVVLPFLSQFGLSGEGGFTLTLKARGCAPLGGGKVQLTCPVVRELSGISITEEGLVKKVRGVAYCARVSPHVANRLATSAKFVCMPLRVCVAARIEAVCNIRFAFVVLMPGVNASIGMSVVAARRWLRAVLENRSNLLHLAKTPS